MPPLVWREKIWICPACLGTVGPDDSVCPSCGAEFESPLGRRIMRSREASNREALWLAMVVSTSVLSVLFLAVALFLSDLHRFVPPIHENALSYSAVLVALILASFYFISSNARKERAGRKISRLARAAPLAAILICCASLTFVAFAKEVDRMLATGFPYILLIGIVLLAVLSISYSRFLAGFRGRESEN
ncbi:MAG: hypothetical protein QXY98_00655 [Thermoplasmata archaeon]